MIKLVIVLVMMIEINNVGQIKKEAEIFKHKNMSYMFVTFKPESFVLLTQKQHSYKLKSYLFEKIVFNFIF